MSATAKHQPCSKMSCWWKGWGVSCSAAGVLDNPNKAAKSVASNAWNLDWEVLGQGTWLGEGKAGGQEWKAVTPLDWGGVSPKLLPIHSPCVCSFTSSQKSQALNMDTHREFPALTPIVRAKTGDFTWHNLKLFERHRWYQSSLC